MIKPFKNSQVFFVHKIGRAKKNIHLQGKIVEKSWIFFLPYKIEKNHESFPQVIN
jgi:hypothetical protein